MPLKRYNVDELTFTDLTFTANYERTIKLCREMKKDVGEVYWNFLTRVDRVYKDLLREMKGAGCWQICWGI